MISQVNSLQMKYGDWEEWSSGRTDPAESDCSDRECIRPASWGDGAPRCKRERSRKGREKAPHPTRGSHSYFYASIYRSIACFLPIDRVIELRFRLMDSMVRLLE